MRFTFRDTLLELAEKDPTIFFVAGDLGHEFMPFKERFPDRYYNHGVMEQSMVSGLVGMAHEGLKPYAYSISPFLVERPFEQIKVGMNTDRANVKLVGYADYPDHGPTHAILDWKLISGAMSNVRFYFPETRADVRSALLESYAHQQPTIILMKKPKE